MSNEINVYVKTCDDISRGCGLYALEEFHTHDIVYELYGKIADTPTRESIHIGDGQHMTDSFGAYINHSFTPSACIVGNLVVALRFIKKDEEITFNYNDTELEMAEPFECNGIMVCGRKTAK